MSRAEDSLVRLFKKKNSRRCSLSFALLAQLYSQINI